MSKPASVSRTRNGRSAAALQQAPQDVKNYITAQGYARLKAELTRLLDVERPELVKVIAWAASNGDRSENGDYIYGKKRLREIDRRIHYLTKRLDMADVVDPARRADSAQIFFGATVTYAYVRSGREGRTITIVGVDEVDVKHGQVSWLSPIARAFLKKRAGDVITLATPAGEAEIEIVDVRYRPSAAWTAARFPRHVPRAHPLPVGGHPDNIGGERRGCRVSGSAATGAVSRERP